jgi:RNA-directed DNA polymerase
MHDSEKSDSAIVAVKPPNKAGLPVAEAVEPRAGAKGNADQQSTHRTQSRKRVTQALSRVRQAARYGKKDRFTALLHHVNADTLRTAFFALKRKAAPGVDGITWQNYEADLEPNLEDLRGRVHPARPHASEAPGNQGEAAAANAPDHPRPGSLAEASRYRPLCVVART